MIVWGVTPKRLASRSINLTFNGEDSPLVCIASRAGGIADRDSGANEQSCTALE